MKFLKARKNILLLFVICITLLLSGCENGVEILSNAEKYSQTIKSDTTTAKVNTKKTTTKVDTKKRTTKVDTTKTTKLNDNKSLSNDNKTESDILMPDGWTNEDFYNFFVINGKALTLPTTLNKLMEFDDRFTYEVVDYIDENSINYKDKKWFGVNVFYNDKFLFATVVFSEKKDEKAMLDIPMCVVIFDKDFCQKAGIDVDTACGLDYNSTYDDIEKILGVPNAESAYSNMVKYVFSDSEYSYVLLFEINNESKKIEKFNVGIYNFKVK